MPDEPDKQKNLPARHRPRLSDLSKETTEEDLWNLEDSMRPTPAEPQSQADTAPIPEKKRPQPTSNEANSPAKPIKPAVITHHSKRTSAPTDPKKDIPDRANPPKASRPNGPRPLDPKFSTLRPKEPELELEKVVTEPETPAPKAESPDPETGKPEPEPSQPKPTQGTEKAPSGKVEKIGLVTFGVIFLGLAIWWIAGLFSSVSTTRIGDDQPDFPVAGNYITVKKAETYWREPIRTGANPDVARREVEFIPVISILIADSKSGVLRAIFRNEEGEFVGDSISHKFATGVFDQNANNTIEFPATDGFNNSGEFNGYRMGTDHWIVEIFEGPSSDAAGSEFKLLFTAPISTNRQ